MINERRLKSRTFRQTSGQFPFVFSFFNYRSHVFIVFCATRHIPAYLRERSPAVFDEQYRVLGTIYEYRLTKTDESIISGLEYAFNQHVLFIFRVGAFENGSKSMKIRCRNACPNTLVRVHEIRLRIKNSTDRVFFVSYGIGLKSIDLSSKCQSIPLYTLAGR